MESGDELMQSGRNEVFESPEEGQAKCRLNQCKFVELMLSFLKSLKYCNYGWKGN